MESNFKVQTPLCHWGHSPASGSPLSWSIDIPQPQGIPGIPVKSVKCLEKKQVLTKKYKPMAGFNEKLSKKLSEFEFFPTNFQLLPSWERSHIPYLLNGTTSSRVDYPNFFPVGGRCFLVSWRVIGLDLESNWKSMVSEMVDGIEPRSWNHDQKNPCGCVFFCDL